MCYWFFFNSFALFLGMTDQYVSVILRQNCSSTFTLRVISIVRMWTESFLFEWLPMIHFFSEVKLNQQVSAHAENAQVYSFSDLKSCVVLLCIFMLGLSAMTCEINTERCVSSFTYRLQLVSAGGDRYTEPYGQLSMWKRRLRKTQLEPARCRHAQGTTVQRNELTTPKKKKNKKKLVMTRLWLNNKKHDALIFKHYFLSSIQRAVREETTANCHFSN